MFRFTSAANANADLMTGEGGINVRALPADVQSVFEDLDANGDGVLDMDEFKTMISTYAVLRKANDEGSVSIAALPAKVQPALKVFDADGDGTVDPKELMRAAEMYQDSKKSQKRMRKMIIGLVLFVVALIGVNAAMTFMMVELGKETKASPDGIMRVNTNQPDHPGAVVRTAANGETGAITSALPDSAFAELKQFEVKSANGAFLSLMVLGWYPRSGCTKSQDRFVRQDHHVRWIYHPGRGRDDVRGDHRQGVLRSRVLGGQRSQTVGHLRAHRPVQLD